MLSLNAICGTVLNLSICIVFLVKDCMGRGFVQECYHCTTLANEDLSILQSLNATEFNVFGLLRDLPQSDDCGDNVDYNRIPANQRSKTRRCPTEMCLKMKVTDGNIREDTLRSCISVIRHASCFTVAAREALVNVCVCAEPLCNRAEKNEVNSSVRSLALLLLLKLQFLLTLRIIR